MTTTTPVATDTVAEAFHTLNQPTQDDVVQLIRDLYNCKQEMDIARQQLNSVIEPMLIDHVILRLGAAETRFNYLIQTARRMNVHLDGIRWDLSRTP